MLSFELDKNDLLRIKEALEADDAALQELLSEFHASEIAIVLEGLSQDSRDRIINILPAEKASDVLSEMDAESHPEKILENLNPEKRSEIVEELDYDDATDIISQLPQEQQNEILLELDEEDASNIRTLLTYAEDSAGGLMNTQVIKVNSNFNKKEALDSVIRLSEEMEEFYTIYVVNDENMLLGIVSLKDIVKSKNSIKIIDLIQTDFEYVKAETDQEEVARLISQYNLTSIPVVDDNMQLLGHITFDDVIDVLEEENTEDILKISGVSEDEELSGNWREAVKSRLPWLILNLMTAFLAASVIRYFDGTIAKLSIIAGYMTMIAGMGGNAATQSLAVTVRRISLNDLTDNQAYRTVLKEFTVGLINGAVTGLIILAVAVIYDQNPMLGLVIFLAMTGNLIIAGVTGSAIPLLLKRVGIDPAIASSIIITTFTDVFGFMLLLGMASYFLL
ncbi:MAG: magnesium transporter [Bacteroidota bacterium]|jgi:magnesium transporter